MKSKRLSFSALKKLVYIGDFFTSKSVSLWEKLKVSTLIVLSIIYFFIPIDIIPDVFFGMGWIEDGAIIIAVLLYVSSMIDKSLQDKAPQKPDNIIDVDFTEVKSK